MGNNPVPKFIFRLSRFPVYRGSVLGRFYCMRVKMAVFSGITWFYDFLCAGRFFFWSVHTIRHDFQIVTFIRITVLYFRHPQRCKWDLSSSGMLRKLEWLVTDVSGPIGLPRNVAPLTIVVRKIPEELRSQSQCRSLIIAMWTVGNQCNRLLRYITYWRFEGS